MRSKMMQLQIVPAEGYSAHCAFLYELMSGVDFFP